MQTLGERKPLGSTIPLGHVQQLGQFPLGQLWANRSLLRQPFPLLGQNLQAHFEQNNQSILSESEMLPSVSAQRVDPGVETSAALVDRQPPPIESRSESSTANFAADALAPLGERQPLTQSKIFLSSKIAPENSVESAVQLRPLQEGAVTPNWIKQFVQAKIQTQVQPQSFITPTQLPQPQIVPLNRGQEATSIQQFSANTETPSEIEFASTNLQRSPNLQADQSNPPPALTADDLQRSPNPQADLADQSTVPSASEGQLRSPILPANLTNSPAVPSANPPEVQPQADLSNSPALPSVSQIQRSLNPQAAPFSPSTTSPINSSGVQPQSDLSSSESESIETQAQSHLGEQQQQVEPSLSESESIKTQTITASMQSQAESLSESAAIESEAQTGSTQPLQRSVEPQRLTVEQSAQAKAIETTFSADRQETPFISPQASVFASEVQPSTSTFLINAAQANTALMEVPPSTSTAQLEPNLTSSSPDQFEAVSSSELAPEAAIDAQNKEVDRSINLSKSELNSTVTTPVQLNRIGSTPTSDALRPLLEAEVGIVEQPVPAVDQLQASDLAAPQAIDQTPVQTRQSTTADLIQRSPSLETDQAIEPLTTSNLPEQARSNFNEFSQTSPQPSTSAQIQQRFDSSQPSSLASPLSPMTAQPELNEDTSQSLVQAQHQSTPPSKNSIDATTSSSPAPHHAELNLSIEPVIQQKTLSEQSTESIVPAQTESVTPQITPTVEPTASQSENQIAFESELEPQTSVSDPPAIEQRIQRSTDAIEAERIEPTADFREAIAPTLLKQSDIKDAPEANSSTVRAKPLDDQSSQKTSPSPVFHPKSDRTNQLDQQTILPSPPAEPATPASEQSLQSATEKTALQAKAEQSNQTIDLINSQQALSTRSNHQTPPMEQSNRSTQPSDTIPTLPQRPPLGQAKPIAQPANLLMPKRELESDQAEPTAIGSLHNWSNIDELLDQSNPSTFEPWQEQFNLPASASEEVVSSIAKSASETPTVDTVQAEQYTLTSPLANLSSSYQENGAIDEQQLELMAQTVYGLIRDQLLVEKERYFHSVSRHPPWIDIISPQFFQSMTLTRKPDSPNAQQHPTVIAYPPQRQLEELTQAIYQQIQQKLKQDRERSR